ncbi:MAG: hypothetical protein VX733_05330 [Candidatus Latescibacterota bacterium]|nr:hypothetical protein [Candidatus Latescibacterota bacterium]
MSIVMWEALLWGPPALLIALFVLPVSVWVRGSRWDVGAKAPIEAEGSVGLFLGLIGIHLRRTEPAWELTPIVVGASLRRPRLRLGCGDGAKEGEEERMTPVASVPEAPEDTDAAAAEPETLSTGPDWRQRLRRIYALTRPMLAPGGKLLRSLLRVVAIRRVQAVGVVGLEDPADTGRAAAVFHALRLALPRRVKIDLAPDFVQIGTRGEVEIRLHIRLWRILTALLHFAAAGLWVFGRIKVSEQMRRWRWL